MKSSLRTFDEQGRFLGTLSIAWWIVYLPFAVMVGRLVWEEVWVTWTQGPQMTGLSLVHMHPSIFIVGALGALGTLVWSGIVAVGLITRRFRLVLLGKLQLGLALMTILMAALPLDQAVLAIRG